MSSPRLVRRARRDCVIARDAVMLDARFPTHVTGDGATVTGDGAAVTALTGLSPPPPTGKAAPPFRDVSSRAVTTGKQSASLDSKADK